MCTNCNAKKKLLSNIIYKEDVNFSRSVIIRVIAQIFLKLQGLIFLPIITKLIGTQSYGIYSQIIITLTLLLPILMLQLQQAIIRFLPGERDPKRISQSFFSFFIIIILFLFFIITVLLFFKGKVAFIVFGSENCQGYMVLFLLILFFQTIYTYLLNYFRTFKRIFFYSIIEISNALLVVIFVLMAFKFLERNLETLLYIKIFMVAFFSFLLLFIIWKEIGFKLYFDVEQIKLFFKYSAPLILSGIMLWVINMSDRYLILHLIGLKEVGIYSASYNLSGTLIFFLTPVLFVLLPTIIKIWNLGKFEEVKRKMEYALRYYVLISLPFIFLLSLLSQSILKILATSDFLTSRLLVFFIVLGYFFLGIYQIFVYIIAFYKKTYILLIYFILIALTNIILNFLLIPLLKLNGAAVATLISYFLLMAITIIMTRRWFKINFEYKFFLKSLLASLLMSIGVFFLKVNNIFYIIATIVAGLLVYIGMLFTSKAFDINDLRIFKSLFKLK